MFGLKFFFCVLFLQIILTCGFDIGWKCKFSSDCTIPESNCTDNYCQCKTGYIFNSNLTSCLKVATSYEELCEDAVQCSAYLLSGASCELQKEKSVCVCGKGYHYLHGRCYRSAGLGDKCKSDDECYVNSDFEASSCKNGICDCSKGFYKREYRTCRREATGVGKTCILDQDCRFGKKAKCNKYKCELDQHSNILSQKLDEYKTIQLNNSVDLKPTNETYLGKECKNDTDCKSHTVCGPHLKCICERTYFNFNFTGTCIPELGEPCLEKDPEKIDLSFCRNGSWSCRDDKVAAKNNQFCRKVTGKYNTSCVYNEQCYIFGPDAFCKKQRCLCNDNSHYIEKEKFCWLNKGIGENCLSDNDCYIRESDFSLSCKKSVCTCPDGTLPNKEKTQCEKIPTGINAKCREPKDCKIKNGTCVSNFCSCIKNFVPLSDDTCVEISSYGNKCDHNIQCNITLINGTCSRNNTDGKNSPSGICTCAPTDHYNNGNCFAKKFLGDSCQNQSECFLERDMENVRCKKGICSCVRKFKKSGNKMCTRSGAAAIYLPIWIGLIATVCNLLIF